MSRSITDLYLEMPGVATLWTINIWYSAYRLFQSAAEVDDDSRSKQQQFYLLLKCVWDRRNSIFELPEFMSTLTYFQDERQNRYIFSFYSILIDLKEKIQDNRMGN
jgi:hypothetical protein